MKPVFLISTSQCIYYTCWARTHVTACMCMMYVVWIAYFVATPLYQSLSSPYMASNMFLFFHSCFGRWWAENVWIISYFWHVGSSSCGPWAWLPSSSSWRLHQPLAPWVTCPSLQLVCFALDCWGWWTAHRKSWRILEGLLTNIAPHFHNWQQWIYEALRTTFFRRTTFYESDIDALLQQQL